MTQYVQGNAEQIAADARRYVRNELKRSNTITVDQAAQLAKYLAAISMARGIPAAVQQSLRRSVFEEFKIDRSFAVLVSTVEAADREKRLRRNYRGAVFP